MNQLGDEKPEKQKSLFEKLYSATTETLKLLKKPTVKNALKRKLRSAYDNAEDKISSSLIAIDEQRKDFEKYDVNKILEEKQKIALCRQHQERIREEYQELFAEEMKTEED